MRASGAPWAPQIPDDWDSLPFFAVFDEIRTKNAGLLETNLLSLSYGRIIRKDISSDAGLLPESFETYQIIEPDTLIFRLTDLQNDHRSLRTARANERGIITSAYGAAIPRQIDARFADYLLRGYDYLKVFYGFGGGVRQSLKLRDISLMPILVPPASTQLAIADYLDRETARIDTLIAKQEQLIATLRERRDAAWAAHFDQAECTFGHISLRRLIASIVDGPFGSALTSKHYSNDGARVVRLGNIGINQFRDDDKAFIPLDYYELLSAHSIKPGDVVVAGLGDDRMPLGRAAVVPRIGPAIVKADCYRLRPEAGIAPEYLAWALSAPPVRDQFRLMSRGSTRSRLNTRIVVDAQIPAVPAGAQVALVTESKARQAKIDTLIAKAERFIELSKERRAALITAAVTGQLEIPTDA